MKKEEIVLWDWKRIMLGQAPPEFLVEVLVRTILIYIVLLVVLRLMGKRMDGQLTLTEMGVMVTLGAIVSVAMQLPDKGFAMGAVALITVAALQRGINWLSVKNEKIEDITQGTMSILIRDGKMQVDEMLRAGISKQHLFSALRGKQILNLGRVKRLYFEACGLFNVYENDQPKPGLPVLPSDESAEITPKLSLDKSHIACRNCGNVELAQLKNNKCNNCGEKKWIVAVV
jgi:uncharacterized membrane protein YcaP (DUF421 family)